jgi:hypothetical protein
VNVFTEPSKDGGYQIETPGAGKPHGGFKTQEQAIEEAKRQGRHPLVARVRHLNDKDKPDHWRAA